MSNFPIACQTITFGPDQKKHYEDIFGVVHNAGYSGVEIGFRHVMNIPPQKLTEDLRENELALVALHVGGNLIDTAQAAGEQREIDRVIQYAKATGTGMVLYSGLKFENDLQFNTDLSMLIKGAEICAENGIKLLYHNHDWEFKNGQRVIRTLLSKAPEDLGLCPDLGWVYRSGADVIDFLETARDRIVAVHLKDFTSNDEGAEFTELGKGRAPLREIGVWLRENTPGMWVILEQDSTSLTPAEAIQINVEYGKKLFGE